MKSYDVLVRYRRTQLTWIREAANSRREAGAQAKKAVMARKRPWSLIPTDESFDVMNVHTVE